MQYDGKPSKIAYVHTHATRADGSRDSFATVKCEMRETPLWWQLRGLSFTATGYGRRIPTRHMVKFNGKWRRVYCFIISNSGTCYIGKDIVSGFTVSEAE